MNLHELIHYVVKTHQVDETGDASLLEFLQDDGAMELYHKDATVEDLLMGYLMWANGGAEWQTNLEKAGK